MNRKKTQIFYVHNGQEVTFGFDDTYHGVMREPNSGLKCEVIKEDDVTCVYIEEVLSGRELLKLIIDNQ